MPDILREDAEHSLDILPNSKPVKQRLRRFNELKRRAIGEEVHKLLAHAHNGPLQFGVFSLRRHERGVDRLLRSSLVRHSLPQF